jgi:23S rRNA (pseudouridine1915-N3)-methyltransferase
MIMNITILCIGKLKEQYWVDGVKEYSKRLSKYCLLTITEMKEEKAPDNPSKAQEIAIVAAEGKTILKQIKGETFVIALDVKGIQYTSEELADKLIQLGLTGKSTVSFVIGGSLGLSEDVLDRADLRLSFSKMTFPHQMIRLILLEQIYRSFKIIKNETYHK